MTVNIFMSLFRKWRHKCVFLFFQQHIPQLVFHPTQDSIGSYMFVRAKYTNPNSNILCGTTGWLQKES